jgi:hypothetical protein
VGQRFIFPSSFSAVGHPSPYVGSSRFAMSILAEMDSQSQQQENVITVSPKKKYRELKKKFKFLVYVSF